MCLNVKDLKQQKYTLEAMYSMQFSQALSLCHSTAAPAYMSVCMAS